MRSAFFVYRRCTFLPPLKSQGEVAEDRSIEHRDLWSFGLPLEDKKLVSQQEVFFFEITEAGEKGSQGCG